MKENLFKSETPFWFTNAVVSLGYHGWGIAPEEVLSEKQSQFFAMRLSVRLAPECGGGPDLRKTASHATFKRVAGRGRYVKEEQLFEVCICTVEATSYTEARGGFWQFM